MYSKLPPITQGMESSFSTGIAGQRLASVFVQRHLS